ncbi:MAG: hypothetical protein VYB65_10805, partial [Myxococcota bacterium]|nr:hypothetical protein [Myxococcota bacterium]
DVVTTYRSCLQQLLDLPPKLSFSKLPAHLLSSLKAGASRGELLEPEAADKVTISLALRRFGELSIVTDESGQVSVDKDQVRQLLSVLAGE